MENVEEKPDSAAWATQTQVETKGGVDTGSNADTSSDNITSNRRKLRLRGQHMRSEAELMPPPAPVPLRVEEVKSEPAQPLILTPGGPNPVPREDVQRQSMQSVAGAHIDIYISMGAQPPPPILQYPDTSGDGSLQYRMPGNNVMTPAATGDMLAYQLHNPTSSLPQGVVLANTNSLQQPAEDATRKREVRLMKNRKAAKACRQRKKEYLKQLETCVAKQEAEIERMRENMLHNLHG